MTSALADVQLRRVGGMNDAEDLMRWLGERRPSPVLAVDTETTGLSPETDQVRLIQVGDSMTGWAIPREGWLGLAREVLTSWSGEMVMHNARYDVAMLRESCGIKLSTDRIRDTRLMAHVLDSNGSTALKALAARFVDARAGLGQRVLDEAMKSSKWTWARVPDDFAPYWTYAALDTVITHRLHDVLAPRVMAEAPEAYQLEAGASWVTERMERHGFRVDRDYALEQRERLRLYVYDAEVWCLQEHGVRPGSNAEVARRLIELGSVLTARTAGGQWRVDKDVLASIDHPLAQTVLARRQAQKTASTYFEAILSNSERDGYVRPSINVIGGVHRTTGESGGGKGVRTGRMSMSDPNLQNVPVRTKEGKMVRNAFIPSEGNILVACDFDQIEMRLLASLARDEAMIEAFASDNDFFVELGRQVFDDPTLGRDDPRRSLVKNAGYAKIYGAGAARFASTAGVTLQSAEAFLHRFDDAYPGVRRLQRELESLATRRLAAEGKAYVRCPLTKRRHVADPGREYALLNYLIQGMAAVILKRKIIELDAAGLGDLMVIPVHDEVILDVPVDQVRDVVATLREVMNDSSIVTVPITASVATGERWGDKKDLPAGAPSG